ncbi:TPA: type IVB secretion system protein DotG/IcmE [Legionella pneumophila]|uniref:Component of the Dot/Icm secretion system. Major component of a channel n=1 Tax=Legionella pneumophila subsp. pneumophila TaxID=91891 RepID=A0AAV2UTN5_LEGPN|nr:type IVB secretion system protein DotG/IcmE [Legionella pneumophila]MCK1847781.1 type IVB secretion system protein DotG/IcmE [Legionella pneumophila]MCZ4804803.1 type IVB secretion system protein DotG/IcmE [Legionella pneumophila]MDI9850607.1 type IVB secretion system protein DotG/IcmE [Legionella pneumophila]MDO5159668.1 type IVB secretion system protein DotG/IcmE [Legionella pneumophila]MDO5162737.1 type IVB secretion system protein DotG/IcmE [Legionella pneumophila]
MASKKENLKSLFSNTRTRVIIIFTAALLIIAVVIGFFKIRSATTSSIAAAEVSTVPGGIQSIPGVLDPTAQYAKLQEEQNVTQAQVAEKTGGSAIPTIIRTQALGEGVGVIGSQSGVGFAALAQEELGGPQRSLWIQELQDGGCSKSVITKVVNQGAQLTDLKAACSCVQLKDSGYGLQELEQVCECKELKAAGYNARQLKEAGYSAGRLRNCGFDACELRNAGFTAQEMKDGGFSDGELKGAGFSDAEIAKASGLPDGITADDVRKAGCGAAALAKLRQAGVSASAIRKISGCTAEQLKAAGYTAKELKDAGFSAADLKRAGFSAAELKDAGFTARDLLNAGFTPADLAKAGFSNAQIKAAQAELPPGITPQDVKNAGCDVEALKKEREAGVSAALIRQYAGCSAQALKAAGFTDADLASAGFTPAQISAATPLSDAEIKAAGCDPDKLKKLFSAGVSAKRIKELNGCSAEALKAAGYDAQSLLAAGFTPQELLAAGFTPKQLEDAGLNPASIIADGRVADCSVESLKKARAAGVSALTIKQTLGCSAAALKAAGYTAKELKDAGFTAAELKAAGFSAKDLKDAGFTAKELRDAGFSAQELKDVGFSAKELKDAGFSAAELKAAGFTAAQLKAAGFSAKDLKDAGFSAAELKAAGFSAKELKDAGFSASDLKNAGFSAKELKDAGFSASDLKGAGFSASELKNAGYSADELKKAGYTSAELRNAGFSPQESAVAGLQGPDLQQLDSSITGIPSIPGATPRPTTSDAASSAEQLQAILQKQNEQLAEQKYQQEIQQRTSDMLTAATQLVQDWKKVETQVYTEGTEETKTSGGESSVPGAGTGAGANNQPVEQGASGAQNQAIIKTGDIMFAVLDTAVNSDEPGPILATIVTGKLKGSKLIGSFNLPSNADKMVITFNTMSIPGAEKTISISAYAIDPNTARTALSSRTNHHYLMRYGSLFASSFLQGFGNAFQSANTTITIGGTGGGNNITVANGVGRSTLENAVIGLATVGKAWSQQAQQLFNTPTTVEVYSGTGLGILFTQDVTTI